MDEILKILSQDARVSYEDIAKMTGRDVAEVEKAVKEYEESGVIVKYEAVINYNLIEQDKPVRALIEVCVTPQEKMGFESVAERIYKFPEVIECYLVSGAYDLLVVVEGTEDTVANFVASKLSSMENVKSTSTHFILRKYKEDGYVLKKIDEPNRPNISY